VILAATVVLLVNLSLADSWELQSRPTGQPVGGAWTTISTPGLIGCGSGCVITRAQLEIPVTDVDADYRARGVRLLVPQEWVDIQNVRVVCLPTGPWTPTGSVGSSKLRMLDATGGTCP
jgi:hypothetical protein